MRNVSRFELYAHGLKVESCKWLDGSNICDECAEVQDEKPALFYCICLECPTESDCNLFVRLGFNFSMLVEHMSPATDQPESRAVGQPFLPGAAQGVGPEIRQNPCQNGVLRKLPLKLYKPGRTRPGIMLDKSSDQVVAKHSACLVSLFAPLLPGKCARVTML
eukprot:895700-Pelagomonas_calceolata.AAC.3